MILNELADFARREGLEDPGYESKPVRWVIAIGPGGKFLGISETEGTVDGRGQIRPKDLQVPRNPPRTNNPPPDFLVDTAEFVLGHDPNGEREPEVLQSRNQAFADYASRALAIAEGDEGLQAVIDFIHDESQRAACLAAKRDSFTNQDKFAFRYPADGELVHNRLAVRSAWGQLREGSGTDQVTCLICGETASAVRIHTQVGFIPGAAKPVPIVSFNEDAFCSYGFIGNQNAPICQKCAESYGTALNRLFHPQYSPPQGGTPLHRRSFKLSHNTAVIYWAAKVGEHQIVDDLVFLDAADPQLVGKLFEAVRSGKYAALDDETAFHAMIVTGGQGRAIIRNYYQTTVGVLARNLKDYYDDIDLVKRNDSARHFPWILRLIRSLAVRGELKNVASDLAGLLLLAIFRGEPFPHTILAAAVNRVRQESEKFKGGKHSRERIALIRATLNRQFRPRPDERSETIPHIRFLINHEIPVMLDPSYPNHAYCLGRLFAVMEKLQAKSIGNVNATITDRFYGAASATPIVVFPTLLRKARHHISKLRRSPLTEKSANSFDKQISDICALMEPVDPFPSTLQLEEQGLFAIGFYHQKAYRRQVEKVEEKASTQES